MKGLKMEGIVARAVREIGCKSVKSVAEFNKVNEDKVRRWFKTDFHKFQKACLNALREIQRIQYEEAHGLLNKMHDSWMILDDPEPEPQKPWYKY